MGNSLVCISTENYKDRKKASKHSPLLAPSSSSRLSSSSSSYKKEINNINNNKDLELDEDLAEQAIAAAMLFRHHQRNGTLPFPRSTSVVHPSQGSNKKQQQQQQGFAKSSSSRQRSVADTLVRPSQLVNLQDLKIDDLETKHFILVHGGGFGAWCWYKVIALLQESGFQVDAIDLTGSGTHSSDTNSITSLSQYVKPLVDVIDNLKEREKVILVGHDIGGACISYVMELFPSKIAKSIFIAAAMLSNGQSTFEILSQQTDFTHLLQQAQILLYANGKSHPPTAIDLDKTFLKDLLFNQSSLKDIALASVSMRPIPFAPILEKLSLSNNNYGSIPRFYIKTQEDCAIPVSLQEATIKSNPPQQVFQLKGSDHAPFFSKPQALHRILVEISQIPKLQA